MKITLRQLEIFLVIAKMENMSRAAEVLFLSQSACSMALTLLEEQLEGQLFDRHNKKLILNDRGKLLFSQAQKIIDQVKELTLLLQIKDNQQLTGSLTIGASTTIGNYLLPIIIAKFRHLHPRTNIRLEINNTQEIIEKLANFEIDAGFIEGSCSHSDLDSTVWRHDELVVIAAPDHPLVKKTRISRQDLQQQKWIIREPGSGTRERFEQAMVDSVIPFLELGHTEAIKQAVAAGIGISCLSKATVEKPLAEGELVALKTPFLSLGREFYKVIHREKYQTLLLKEFIKFAV